MTPGWPARSLALRRHDILHGADPAGMGEIEHDPERILVFGLVIGVRARRLSYSCGLGTAREIFAAGFDHFLFGLVEIIDPHAEMVDSDRFVPLLLEQRHVHHAIRDIKTAPGLARNLHVESILEEPGGFFRIGNDERDVAKLGHDVFPYWCLGMVNNS